MADRKGRLENRPMRIKAELFPYDSCPVQALVLSLSEKGFITLYESNKQSYIQINNFEKHQFPHHREADSLIPAQVKPRASLGKAHLNPSSLNPDVLNPSIPMAKIEEWFLKTWDNYPKDRRHGKDVAFKRYQKAVKTLDDARDVARALDNYLVSKVVTDGFVMRGSKWFDEWEDWKVDRREHDDRRGGEGIYDTTADARTDQRSPGEGIAAPIANTMFQQLSDSKRLSK